MPIDTPHGQYTFYAPAWERCRDLVGGEDIVKSRKTKYLPLLEGQGTEEDVGYKGYLSRAMFFPALERTIAGLTGTILRKPPTIVAPPSVTSFLDDLLLSRDTLQGALLYVLGELLTVGRIGIFTDWNADLLRPYWTEYEAESIINWSEVKDQGQRRLEWVVLKEIQPVSDAGDRYKVGTEVRYREVFTDGVGEARKTWSRLWMKPPKGDKWVAAPPTPLMRRGTALTTIPFTCLGPRRVQMDVAKPPLIDLANLNLSHYRTSADLEHGRHFVALPTPWITGWAGNADGSPLKIGSGTAWTIPSENAKIGMLEFEGAGLESLRNALLDKEKNMAVIGARLLEEQPKAAETAEAVRLRQAGEHSVLAVMTGAASTGLTLALQWFAFWLGTSPEAMKKVSFELSKDFFAARLSAQDAQALIQAWQAEAISYETLYWNLQNGEWARPGIDWEEEKEQIDEESALDPEDDLAPLPGEGISPGKGETPEQTGEDEKPAFGGRKPGAVN